METINFDSVISIVHNKYLYKIGFFESIIQEQYKQ